MARAIPETIDSQILGDGTPRANQEFCNFVVRWGIDPDLLTKLIAAADMLPFGLKIREGYRSRARADKLRAELPEGRVAPDELSTHRTFPATGADVIPSITATTNVKALMGNAFHLAGLRWGGADVPTLDDDTGLPVEWWHVDLGRRAPGSCSSDR